MTRVFLTCGLSLLIGWKRRQDFFQTFETTFIHKPIKSYITYISCTSVSMFKLCMDVSPLSCTLIVVHITITCYAGNKRVTRQAPQDLDLINQSACEKDVVESESDRMSDKITKCRFFFFTYVVCNVAVCSSKLI